MIGQWQQNSYGAWCLADSLGAYVITGSEDTLEWNVEYHVYDRTGGVTAEVFLCTSGSLSTAKFFAEQDYRAAQAQERINQ